jgi:hypothetical protein
MWIGMNDIATEGISVWTDGDLSIFRSWGPGEPNDPGGLHVVFQ